MREVARPGEESPTPNPAEAGKDAAASERREAAAARRRRYHPRSRSTLIADVLDQSAAALRARAKSRGITLSVESSSARRVARVSTLRECFLVLLADTLDTADHGSAVRVELRDLAGGRVELAISDTSRGAELVDRALEKRDGSGRARTLSRTFERLAIDHQARWVSDADDSGRRLLVDIGFPDEEE